jgi:uncharacterized membrane-anchored protein
MINFLEKHFDTTRPSKETAPCLVPQVTFWFWICKCCATTVGETVSDFFNSLFDPCQCTQRGLGFDALLFVPLLLGFLYLQLRSETYQPRIYWTCIILASIVGTIITDGFHDNWGLMVWIEVIIFFVAMCLCFYFWHHSEHTLDIHSITTTRRQVYYWGTVIWTFALGTAVGDCTANHWLIGFGPILGFFAAIVFMFFVVWLVGRYTGLIKKDDAAEILLFWLVYIMTRPLGASTGDLLGESKQNGGLGLGTGWTSLLFFGIIVIIVCYLEYSGIDQITHQKVNDASNLSGDVELGETPNRSNNLVKTDEPALNT